MRKISPELIEKVRFFSQYLFQKVFRYENIGRSSGLFYPHLLNNLDGAFLVLRPLGIISKAEAISVAKIGGYSNFSSVKFEENGYWIIWRKGSIKPRKMYILMININQPQIDYLRSQGYAVPWNGISVADQEKRGWIKLSSDIPLTGYFKKQ